MSKFFSFNSQNGIIHKNFTSLINNALKISHRILFQCCSISNSFLAIGCNTGNIYVFIIHNSKFKYWSNIITNDSCINGMQFSPTKHYLAYHNKRNQIIIYKLNLTNEKNVLIRTIEGTQNCCIQSLIWDEECSRIFCGYSNGVIDVIYVPHNAKDFFHVPSEGLLKLDRQDIVQIDLMQELLLVSTNEKVVLLNTQSKYMTLIGTKPRSGQYGACFWYDNSKQLKIVSARPGYRLWIALVDGTVEETQQYKTWNNSLKYKISDSAARPTGSGQYVTLAMIKNSNLLVAIENDGPLFVIDLIKKACISVIDYGTNLPRVLCNSDRIIFNSQREVVCLAISTIKDALVTILNEDIDSKYAIDLFIDVMDSSANANNVESNRDDRKISNTLPPDLLSRIVQKSAENNYRFAETNKLQVYIQDNEEYQNIFGSSRQNEETDSIQGTSSSVVEFPDDGSTESDCSNDHIKRGKMITKRPEKRRGFTKTPQLLQTIYDKTSSFLSNIDVLSSSNSDIPINMADSFSEHVQLDDREDTESNSLQDIANSIPENMKSTINLMELEANGYIASEKFKQRDLDEESKNDFLESLSNFCETWLSLNIYQWQRLKNFELYIRNLSASFLIFNAKSSVSSSDSSHLTADDTFIQDQLNAQFSNSWTTTITVADWMKALPVSDKIYQMTSTLLSQCFFYETFENFPELIEKMDVLMGKCVREKTVECSVDCHDNEFDAEVVDVETQTEDKGSETDTTSIAYDNRYNVLMDILTQQIWNQNMNTCWISSIIKYFYEFLNIKSLRQWIRSGISHSVWTVALNSFHDICLVTGKKEGHLSDISHADLEKLLYNSLCADTIYTFVEIDEILSIMKEFGVINWRMMVESENLDCRDVLHFCLKYDLDLTDYVVHLFSYVNLSIKFSSRYNLLEHIYSQSDVVVSFIYSLLYNGSSNPIVPQVCDCGLLLTYSEIIVPENINTLTIEILKWGADQGIFKKNAQMLTIFMKLCLDSGYHQGYIELLVGMTAVDDLVKIGIQVANLDILQRLKDCAVLSLGSMIELIYFIIECRRNQTKEPDHIHCLTCDKRIQYDDLNVTPLSWHDIGRLIFDQLIENFSCLEIMHNILPKLTGNEMDQMKELLTNSIETILQNRKVVERNQMTKFIKSEMNPDEAGGEITEKYLNIYTMTKHELSGQNWGKIITGNMVCGLCGIKLLTKNCASTDTEIIGFCCNHSFHRNCFLQFGAGDDCFLC